MEEVKKKSKAKEIMKEKKWDNSLIEAYHNLQHYPSWSKEVNFEEKLNIGVKNVSGIKKDIDVGYIKGEVTFVKCDFDSINFMIGGETKFSSSPDGSSWCTHAVSLFIDEIRVLAVMYSVKEDKYDRGLLPSDCSLLSVEEFHAHKKIDVLLNGLHNAANELKIRNEKIRCEEDEKKYSGKFSFDE
jgi:hypothetical protein